MKGARPGSLAPFLFPCRFLQDPEISPRPILSCWGSDSTKARGKFHPSNCNQRKGTKPGSLVLLLLYPYTSEHKAYQNRTPKTPLDRPAVAMVFPASFWLKASLRIGPSAVQGSSGPGKSRLAHSRQSRPARHRDSKSGAQNRLPWL